MGGVEVVKGTGEKLTITKVHFVPSMHARLLSILTSQIREQR